MMTKKILITIGVIIVAVVLLVGYAQRPKLNPQQFSAEIQSPASICSNWTLLKKDSFEYEKTFKPSDYPKEWWKKESWNELEWYLEVPNWYGETSADYSFSGARSAKITINKYARKGFIRAFLEAPEFKHWDAPKKAMSFRFYLPEGLYETRLADGVWINIDIIDSKNKVWKNAIAGIDRFGNIVYGNGYGSITSKRPYTYFDGGFTIDYGKWYKLELYADFSKFGPDKRGMVLKLHTDEKTYEWALPLNSWSDNDWEGKAKWFESSVAVYYFGITQTAKNPRITKGYFDDVELYVCKDKKPKVEVKVETICTDGIDNDEDGLIDNEDGDCWSREPVFIEDYDPLPTFKNLEALLPSLKESGIKTIELQGIYEHCTSEEHGYRWQVRDYFKLDPKRGTQADLESFLAQAHRLDMKVISFISLEDATPPKFLWRALFIIGFMGYDKDGIGGHFYRYQMEHPEKKILLRNLKGKFACHSYGWGYAVDCSSEDVALEWERILKYILMELGFDGVRVDSPDKNYCHKHEKIYIRCKELSCIDPVEGDYPSLPLYRRLKKMLKPDQVFISEAPSTYSAHVKWFCKFPYYAPYTDMDEVAEVSEDYGFTPILLRIVLSGQGPVQRELEKILFKTVARTEEKIGSEDLVKWVNKQYAEHVLHNRERFRFFRNWNYLEIPLFKFISIDPRYFPAVTLLSTIRGVPKVSYYELFGHPKEKDYFPNAINTPEIRQLHWKKILNIRSSHNALKYGSMKNVWISGDNTYAYLREYEDKKVIVATNFLDKEAVSYLDLSFFPEGTILYDELNDEKFTIDNPSNFKISVPKHGSRILIINNTE